MQLNPFLKTLPVYQPWPARSNKLPRELGLSPPIIIKVASNENPFGPFAPGGARPLQAGAPRA